MLELSLENLTDVISEILAVSFYGYEKYITLSVVKFSLLNFKA
jgi:hypothetical protein